MFNYKVYPWQKSFEEKIEFEGEFLKIMLRKNENNSCSLSSKTSCVSKTIISFIDWNDIKFLSLSMYHRIFRTKYVCML